MRLMQVFMGDDGPARFLAVYELYINFSCDPEVRRTLGHRYQMRRERKRRYPYAGMCPLEIAGQSLMVEVEDRRLAATWLDALGI